MVHIGREQKTKTVSLWIRVLQVVLGGHISLQCKDDINCYLMVLNDHLHPMLKQNVVPRVPLQPLVHTSLSNKLLHFTCFNSQLVAQSSIYKQSIHDVEESRFLGSQKQRSVPFPSHFCFSDSLKMCRIAMTGTGRGRLLSFAWIFI